MKTNYLYLKNVFCLNNFVSEFVMAIQCCIIEDILNGVGDGVPWRKRPVSFQTIAQLQCLRRLYHAYSGNEDWSPRLRSFSRGVSRKKCLYPTVDFQIFFCLETFVVGDGKKQFLLWFFICMCKEKQEKICFCIAKEKCRQASEAIWKSRVG